MCVFTVQYVVLVGMVMKSENLAPSNPRENWLVQLYLIYLLPFSRQSVAETVAVVKSYKIVDVKSSFADLPPLFFVCCFDLTIQTSAIP